MTTHNQFQQCTESISATHRTLVGKIEGMKLEQSMNLDILKTEHEEKEKANKDKCTLDHRQKFKEIFQAIDKVKSQVADMRMEQSVFEANFKRTHDDLETKIIPDVTDLKRQVSNHSQKQVLQDNLI